MERENEELKSEPRVRQRVVDSREPDTIREKLLELGWNQQKLISGDFWFHACNFIRIGFTRKTVDDLLNSISSRSDPHNPGRKEKPFGQHLEEMKDFYDIKTIILEGSWRKVSPNDSIISRRGVQYQTWAMVWNFLRTWQDQGFSLELTTDEGHTIQRLGELFAYYQKPFHTGGMIHGNVSDDRILAFPSGCRGKTALGALKGKSLADISNMTIKELVEIEGVGNKRAEQIRIHFNRR